MTKDGAGYKGSSEVYNRNDEKVYSYSLLSEIQRNVLPNAVSL